MQSRPELLPTYPRLGWLRFDRGRQRRALVRFVGRFEVASRDHVQGSRVAQDPDDLVEIRSRERVLRPLVELGLTRLIVDLEPNVGRRLPEPALEDVSPPRTRGRAAGCAGRA